MSTAYPLSIQQFLDLQRYADAIQNCRSLSIDSTPIQAIVQSRVDEALAAYSSGDFASSLATFLLTIGVLEPSVVVSKFYTPTLMTYLIRYLMELHTRGFAKPAFTKLLFTLFARGEYQEELISFISFVESAQTQKAQVAQPQRSKGEKKPKLDLFMIDAQRFLQNFQSDLAIETLKQFGLNAEASKLSQAIGISMASVDSLIEGQRFVEAATRISECVEDAIGQSMLMKFGPSLLKHPMAAKIVEQTAAVIWKSRSEQSDTDFLKLFWNAPLSCYRFLKSIVNDGITPCLATTLIALVIPRENATPDSFYGNPAVIRLDDARALMADQRLHYDPVFLLSVCVFVKFWRGVVFLLSRLGRASDAVSILRQERQVNELAEFLRTDPTLPSDDWVALFDEFVCNEGWALFRERDRLEFMERIISHVKNLLSPAIIRQRLERNPSLPARQLFPDDLDRDDMRSAIITRIEEEIEQRKAQTQPPSHTGGQIKCCACGEAMSPPFTRFFCGHCFHRGCVTLNDDRRPSCVICRWIPGRQPP
jgi:hypothetical protein